MKNLRTGTAKFDTIRAKDANGLSIQDDGGNGLFIKDGGNVGIGTTNPEAELHVAGSQIVNEKTTYKQADGTDVGSIGRSSLFVLGGGTNDLGIASNDSIQFAVNGADQVMMIDSAGNVGIGTTNPAQKLDVNGVGTFRVPTGGQTFISWSQGQATSENQPVITLRTNEPNNSDRVRFNSDGDSYFNGGNVGIGTTNPVSVLDVHGTIALNSVGAYVSLTNSGGDANSNDLTLTASQSTNSVVARCAQKFIVQTFANSAYQNRLTILNNGRVGIGTTNPGAKLEVSGTAMINNPSNDSGLWFGTNNTVQGYIGGGDFAVNGLGAGEFAISSAVGGALVFGINGTEKMRIHSSGNVGIGTTSPTAKLYVNGSTFSTTGWSSSDDRVKHNEQAIVGAIETLGKITPKKYIKTTEMYEANHDFELDADGNPVDADGEPVEHSIEAGVIAQQVLEVPELAFMVSPESVDEDGNVTSPHGLNYNSLFTYAIAAIQEQQSIIEDLKSQNASLESRISALES